MVQRRKLPLPAGSWVYELTDWGRELEPLIMARAMGRAHSDLVLGEERFHAKIAAGRMKLERGGARAPDAIIEADPNTLAAVVYGEVKLADALRSGDLKVEGDKSVVKRFVTLFPLPERAATIPPARTTPGNKRG